VLAALTGAAACSSRNIATPPAPGKWHLAFEDEFPGTSLNPGKWVTCYDWNDGGCTNPGNAELEWYLPEQVKVADGAAVLTAQRKDTAGSGGHVFPWTSGMLSTGRPAWDADPRFVFTYGYLEANIRMPAEDSMFPAFWLLSADKRGSPEIDVAEMYGSRETAHMSLHWQTAEGTPSVKSSTHGPLDFSAAYHDFGVDWEPGHVTWYIDGVPRYSVSEGESVPTTPMEILFTLAIGFPRPPPDGVTSATMSIRRVRLWQH
jgi:beta-glucanase (GH16 family)